MSQLPKSLSYGANQMPFRVNKYQVMPVGSDINGPNSTCRFRFPEKSIIRLSSTTLTFDVTINGLTNTDGNNWNKALFPPAQYAFFKQVRWYCNGVLCTGLNNHYNQIYHALLRSSVGEDYINSRALSGLQQHLGQEDEEGVLQVRKTATSKSGSYICEDILGLSRANGGESIIDTSIFGTIELEIIFDDKNVLACFGASNTGDANAQAAAIATGNSAISWQLSNLRALCDVVTVVPPLYMSLMSARLKSSEPLKFAYENIVSIVANRLTSNRINVNTQCLDALMICCLGSTWNDGNNQADATTQFNKKFRFTSGKGLNDVNCNLQIQVGSEVYPKIPIQNLLHCSDYTVNAFHPHSSFSQNLLFQNISGASNASAGSQTYKKANYLTENFIWVMPFAAEQGWASETHTLGGIDTASQNVDIIINSGTNDFQANTYYLLAALTTATLEFDPQSTATRVVY
jgi:hypothetical protein